MFLEEDLIEAKPKRRGLRCLVLLLVPLIVLGAAAGAVFLAAQAWERRLEPPQSQARGAQASAEAVSVPAVSPPAEPTLYNVGGSVLITDSEAGIGAIVTAKGPQMRLSLYSPDGGYRFDGLPSGSYELVATRRGRLATQKLELSAEKKPRVRAGVVQLDLRLTERDPDPFPSAYFYEHIHFTSPEISRDFRLQCNDCHQLGDAKTRRGRDIKAWESIVERMAAMGAVLRLETARALPEILAAGLNGGRNLELPLPPLPEPALAKTRIREWPLGEADAYLHGVAATADGRIWAVDMHRDTLHALDPKTGQEQRWRLPDRGIPRGGILRAASRPLGTTLAHLAPSDLVVGEDGRLWMTCTLGNEIVAFDPSSAKTSHWSLPRGGLGPVALRVRGNGVWFTAALSNHLGHIDLSTNEVRLIELPASNWPQRASRLLLPTLLGLAAGQPQSDAHMTYNIEKFTREGASYLPRPEGLDVHSDGSVWYAKLYEDRIGRYDPATGAIREWPTPFNGPRRMQFDRDGNLWIAAFGSSGLARFDPKAEAFASFPLPIQPPLADRPFAAAVDPRDGRIWVGSSSMDMLYRFSPQPKTFEIFPLPTRTAYVRQLAFSLAGEVCATYSNVPSEPGPKLMCLSPPS
jgi:streptogramin lyase